MKLLRMTFSCYIRYDNIDKEFKASTMAMSRPKTWKWPELKHKTFYKLKTK